MADPANKICDAPGSWYCVGQYPPAIQWLIDKRKPFKQLEDFNTKASDEDEKYQQEYHRRMSGRGGGGGGDGREVAATYVGCYGAEKHLGADREYAGGPYGTSVSLAREFAVQSGKKYFALAQVGVDGHAFAFSEPPKGKEYNDMGCTEPCGDDERYSCGCADEACGDLRPARGEDNVRRWVVYRVDKAKGKKGKNNRREASKEEL